MKCCTRCGHEKPLIDFHKNKASKDGHQNTCKACYTEKAKARYLEKKDHILSVSREWAVKNREKRRESSRKRYAENPQKHCEYASAWKKKNRQRATLWQLQRHAAQRGATPPWFEKEAVANVYEKASEFGFQVDHIVPLKGKTVCGLHCWANLQLLDPLLNNIKGNREWPDMP
jgi:hypothetical protein